MTITLVDENLVSGLTPADRAMNAEMMADMMLLRADSIVRVSPFKFGMAADTPAILILLCADAGAVVFTQLFAPFGIIMNLVWLGVRHTSNTIGQPLRYMDRINGGSYQ